MNLRANSSDVLRTSSGERPRDSFTTLNSIGSPWQSQPGTYGARKPSMRLRFHDEILENLVQRRAHVDVAIGERRAVVQHEELPALRAPPESARRAVLPPIRAAPARA